jgi:hypothetical protein
MSEPLESALAGVGVHAPHQADFPLGDVGHHIEAPGDLHLGQAAAAPTHGELQVASEDPPINSEFEAGGGEALLPPAPSGPETALTATADSVVGVHLQQGVPKNMLLWNRHIVFWHRIIEKCIDVQCNVYT